jgi:hypothetical protein
MFYCDPHYGVERLTVTATTAIAATITTNITTTATNTAPESHSESLCQMLIFPNPLNFEPEPHIQGPHIK